MTIEFWNLKCQWNYKHLESKCVRCTLKNHQIHLSIGMFILNICRLRMRNQSFMKIWNMMNLLGQNRDFMSLDSWFKVPESAYHIVVNPQNGINLIMLAKTLIYTRTQPHRAKKRKNFFNVINTMIEPNKLLKHSPYTLISI